MNPPQQLSIDPTTLQLPNWRLITKESLSQDDDECSVLLEQRCPWSLQVFSDSLKWYDQLQLCNDTYISHEIQESLKVLNDAYRLYGPSFGVICSFNGGKDACVILELVRAAHAKYYQDLITQQVADNNNNNNTKNPRTIPTIVRPCVVYWEKDGEFPQVLEFVKETVQRYDLDTIVFEQGIHFTQGLQLLVDQGKTPLAFVLGTRTTDPNGQGQEVWEPSSSSFMPPFMRVNPILLWNYGQVWQFLRSFQLPVCSLYQAGYTSLGTTDDTLPNPHLYIPSVNRHRPAWMLTDYDQERAGRGKNPNLKSPTARKTDSPSNNSSQSNLSILSKTQGEPPVDQVPEVICSQPKRLLNSVASDISYGADTVTQRTVGLLIVGDEILKGYTVDTNSQTAASVLRQENVLLKRIAVVSDEMEEIVDEIVRMQDKVDIIITSGGVGPTHDDVTIKSVAAAFDDEMILHEEMAGLLREKMKTPLTADLTDAQIKMATLPRHSRLRYLSNDDAQAWPVLQYRNLFILPGVPEFFRSKIEQVAKYLSCQAETSSGYKVVLSADENAIVPFLNQVVERHAKFVSFGSYPFVNQPDRKTVITVEAKFSPCGNSSNKIEFAPISKEIMDRHVQEALDDLISTLPDDCVLRVDSDDMRL